MFDYTITLTHTSVIHTTLPYVRTYARARANFAIGRMIDGGDIRKSVSQQHRRSSPSTPSVGHLAPVPISKSARGLLLLEIRLGLRRLRVRIQPPSPSKIQFGPPKVHIYDWSFPPPYYWSVSINHVNNFRASCNPSPPPQGPNLDLDSPNTAARKIFLRSQNLGDALVGPGTGEQYVNRIHIICLLLNS